MSYFQPVSAVTPPFQASSRPHLYYSLAKRLCKLRRRPVDISRLGAHWRLYPRDWIDNRLIVGRPFEFDQLNFVFKRLQKHNVDLFVDCGANIGLYSVLLGVHAKSIQEIIAFEPVPSTFERLTHHIKINGLEEKVTCKRLALGDRSDVAEIQFTPHSSGVATLSERVITRGNRNFTETLEISIEPFDKLNTSTGRNVFIKIDVEGYTLSVLNGMTQFLSNNTCLLQVETAEDAEEILRTLAPLGYKLIHAINEDHYFSNSTKETVIK